MVHWWLTISISKFHCKIFQKIQEPNGTHRNHTSREAEDLFLETSVLTEPRHKVPVVGYLTAAPQGGLPTMMVGCNQVVWWKHCRFVAVKLRIAILEGCCPFNHLPMHCGARTCPLQLIVSGLIPAFWISPCAEISPNEPNMHNLGDPPPTNAG